MGGQPCSLVLGRNRVLGPLWRKDTGPAAGSIIRKSLPNFGPKFRAWAQTWHVLTLSLVWAPGDSSTKEVLKTVCGKHSQVWATLGPLPIVPKLHIESSVLVLSTWFSLGAQQPESLLQLNSRYNIHASYRVSKLNFKRAVHLPKFQHFRYQHEKK